MNQYDLKNINKFTFRKKNILKLKSIEICVDGTVLFL